MERRCSEHNLADPKAAIKDLRLHFQKTPEEIQNLAEMLINLHLVTHHRQLLSPDNVKMLEERNRELERGVEAAVLTKIRQAIFRGKHFVKAA